MSRYHRKPHGPYPCFDPDCTYCEYLAEQNDWDERHAEASEQECLDAADKEARR